MSTILQGIKARHYIISDGCVKTRGLDGAIDFAIKGLKEEFAALYKNWEGKGAKFHLALTIEKPECKPEPVDDSHVGEPIDPESRVTNSGNEAELPNESSAPAPVNPETGQHKDYWVLSEQERSKGFVRPVRHTYVHNKCGVATKMGTQIAETYARNPKFYGSTFCVGSKCKTHFPVCEFVWDDGTAVGS